MSATQNPHLHPRCYVGRCTGGRTSHSRTRHRHEARQVMGYFWVNQAQEYLQSLGFGSTLRPVNMHSQDLRIDQLGIDNSFQVAKQDYIRLGKAVTVGLAAAKQYGWPVKAEETCPMDWDATSYTSAPHCIRRFDLNLTARHITF